jgi:hypothetical protein
MFFNKLYTHLPTQKILGIFIVLSSFLSVQNAFSGQYIIPLNDFSFTATGPMGLGRAAVVDANNLGYQMVESSIAITASATQTSQIIVDYTVNSTIVDGIYTTTIDATAVMYLYFDVLITDIDTVYDYQGKVAGASYSFPGIAATTTLDYVSSTATTASFVVATGTDTTSDLLGVSLALNVDVNGVDVNLAPIDATIAGNEGYLDVIKFSSNEFLTAFSNIVFSLNNGTITYDTTPAILSGGIQDDYLDPEFSFNMVPSKASSNSRSFNTGLSTKTKLMIMLGKREI